jgi:hypothetical protein
MTDILDTVEAALAQMTPGCPGAAWSKSPDAEADNKIVEWSVCMSRNEYAALATLVNAAPALVAEVRRLQAENAQLVDLPKCRLQLPDGTVPGNTEEALDAWHNAYYVERASHATTKAELAALKAQTCQACEYSFVGMAPTGRPHIQFCKRTRIPYPEMGTQTYVPCECLGNTCGSWQKREA